MSNAPNQSLLKQTVGFLASYGFAVVLLLFLLLLTFLGTIAQVNESLFEVQGRYFESWIVFQNVWGVPVPLPGVTLLLILLTINLLLGGFVRIRKSAQTVGVIVVHIGIVVMLLAGLVEYKASTKGHMTLYEGDTAAEYMSHFEWEMVIADEAGTLEYVVPGKKFITLDDDRTAHFSSSALPFEVSVGNVFKNCEVRSASQHTEGDPVIVNGFFLHELEPDKQAERNMAGMYVEVTPNDGGSKQLGILWAWQAFPWRVQVDGKIWMLDVEHYRWDVPFEIKLIDFRKQDYPGMTMAKSFESDVLKVEDGVETEINISMNEPLRHKGYTFFQSSWGPSNARPGDPLFSTFSVVSNPADQWPLYSCIIITVGLLLHFTRKLTHHVRTELGRRA